jgi:hypothetical protein
MSTQAGMITFHDADVARPLETMNNAIPDLVFVVRLSCIPNVHHIPLRSVKGRQGSFYK